MIVPQITCAAGRDAYLWAVFKVTGIWQMEVSQWDWQNVNHHIAKMWSITFTEAQQEAIIVKFIELRLEVS